MQAPFGIQRSFDYLLAGLRGVLRHKLRSFLAVLGMVLAISALLSMLAVGEGARQQILQEMEHLGLRNVILTSHRPPKKATQENQGQTRNVESFGLTRKDLQRCKDIVPGLSRALAIHEIHNPV